GAESQLLVRLLQPGRCLRGRGAERSGHPELREGRPARAAEPGSRSEAEGASRPGQVAVDAVRVAPSSRRIWAARRPAVLVDGIQIVTVPAFFGGIASPLTDALDIAAAVVFVLLL